MTAKHPKTAPAPLRDQITAFLTRKESATLKDIAKHSSEALYPSRVLAELNKMRTDALVECEKRKGKGNEYLYWLVTTPVPSSEPQPVEGGDTGSDGSGVNVLVAVPEADAVQEPAPEAAAPTAAPVAADDTDEMPPADPVLLASANRMLSERLQLAEAARDELARLYKEKDAELLSHASAVVSLRAELGASEQKRIETTGALTRSMQDLDTIRELLAPFSGDIDPSDMTEVELARTAAETIRNLLATVENMAQGDAAVDVLDAASAYLIRIPKRRPRVITKPEKVRDAAVAAVRNGAERADVFALIPLGTAKRGAEWTDAN